MPLSPGDVSLRYSIMLSGAGRGLSGAAVLRELQDAGLGMRRSDFYDLYNQAKTFYATQGATAALDLDNPVPPSAITAWPSRTMTGYGYVVKIATREIGTGTLGDRYHTIISDQLLSPGEAIQRALDDNADNARRYEYTHVGAALQNVVQYVQTPEL